MRSFIFACFLFVSAVMPWRLQAERAAFGSDENGYYFPQEMAEWCELDSKDNIDDAVIRKCLTKICSDYKTSDFTLLRENKKRFQKMMLQVWANALLASIEAKKKYANAKEDEKAEKTQEEAGTDVRTQTGGNASINETGNTMYADLIKLKAVLAELQAFSLLGSNCELFAVKGEETKK